MTSIDYAMVSKCWTRNKSALTRARKSGDPVKVLAATRQAYLDFEEYGWPDNWALFARAHDDALYDLAREVYWS